jgi:hypothetical protein
MRHLRRFVNVTMKAAAARKHGALKLRYDACVAPTEPLAPSETLSLRERCPG